MKAAFPGTTESQNETRSLITQVQMTAATTVLEGQLEGSVIHGHGAKKISGKSELSRFYFTYRS